MVTISMLTGPNGLLNKAVDAKIENAHGEVREKLQLETNVYLSEKLEGKYTEDLLTYLKEQGFVEEETNKVIMEKLMDGQVLETGKGTGEKDVYKIEEKTEETGSTTEIASTNPVKIAASGDSNVKEYSINYYDESGNKKEIGLLIDNLESGSANEEPKNMISFEINDVSYECEEGSTWDDWMKSSDCPLDLWCPKHSPRPGYSCEFFYEDRDGSIKPYSDTPCFIMVGDPPASITAKEPYDYYICYEPSGYVINNTATYMGCQDKIYTDCPYVF